jgi:Xaa-Pro aminopeptidase
VDTSTLAAALRTARAVKTEYELTMLRHSSQVATDAHIKAWEATSLVPPFNNEFVVANAFESASYSCGLRFQAYIPIVASGPNSATLHYNANDRTFVDGDLMLIDAAPETKGYTSDVSRTYPVNGKFSADQKLVYDIVLNAQNAAIEVFVPGYVHMLFCTCPPSRCALPAFYCDQTFSPPPLLLLLDPLVQ